MKKIFALFAGAVLLAACSSPRYSYYFDHYDYNSGKKTAIAAPVVEAPANAQLTDESLLVLQKETLQASAEPYLIASPAPIASVNKPMPTEKISVRSKTEVKALKKKLITQIKELKKIKKDLPPSADKSKVLDYDLKMAIIFGAVALTLSLFGGVNSVFWVASVISLVIGVVFLVKWIAEQ
jgi:hypothetical protein